jgi:Zn finger protein HypA/HybF involved in hydrogenase expression
MAEPAFDVWDLLQRETLTETIPLKAQEEGPVLRCTICTHHFVSRPPTRLEPSFAIWCDECRGIFN